MHDRRRTATLVAAVALVVLLVLAILREGQQAREEQVACDPRARPAEQLVGRLPGGWRAQPAPREVLDRAREVVEGEPRRLTAVSILRGSDQLAAVVAVEQDKPISRRQLVDGLENAEGRPGSDVPLGTAQGRLVAERDGFTTVAGISDECGAVYVFAATPDIGRRVAATLAVRDTG